MPILQFAMTKITGPVASDSFDNIEVAIFVNVNVRKYPYPTTQQGLKLLGVQGT